MVTQAASARLRGCSASANQRLIAEPALPSMPACARLTDATPLRTSTDFSRPHAEERTKLASRSTGRPHPSRRCCAPPQDEGGRSSPLLEDRIEVLAPHLLLGRRQQHGDHLALANGVERVGRVRLNVSARRRAPELGIELLHLLTEHEIGG